MKVLLDAHALLWFLAGSSQLSTKALSCIQDSWCSFGADDIPAFSSPRIDDKVFATDANMTAPVARRTLQPISLVSGCDGLSAGQYLTGGKVLSAWKANTLAYSTRSPRIFQRIGQAGVTSVNS